MPSFKKSWRLRKRVEFTGVAEFGSKFYLTNFIVIMALSDLSWPRIGITVSRKVGNSVCRNRLKRLVREFFRNNKSLFPSADFNIIARTSAAKLGYDAVYQELTNGLCRICQQTCR